MAVKKKAKPTAKKKTVKKPTPKKIVKVAAKAIARSVDKKLVKIARKAPVQATAWFITQIVVDHMAVFGIANDGRIYRWSARAAVWVLHKEGLV